jgi:hypothetical protein
LGNFALAGRYLPEGENVIVVLNGEEDLLDEDGIKVRIVPLRKFLLE